MLLQRNFQFQTSSTILVIKKISYLNSPFLLLFVIINLQLRSCIFTFTFELFLCFRSFANPTLHEAADGWGTAAIQRGVAAGSGGPSGSRLQPNNSAAPLQTTSHGHGITAEVRLVFRSHRRDALRKTGSHDEIEQEVHRTSVGRRLASTESRRAKER